jgi:hypothetical protein
VTDPTTLPTQTWTDLSNVTGPEPPIVGKAFLRDIRPLVVTPGDRTPSQPDFTLRRVVARQVTSLGVVMQLDLERGYDAADSGVLFETSRLSFKWFVKLFSDRAYLEESRGQNAAHSTSLGSTY